MKKEITITAEQVEKMLRYHAEIERKFDHYKAEGSDLVAKRYAGEGIAIERIFDIIGIEY